MMIRFSDLKFDNTDHKKWRIFFGGGGKKKSCNFETVTTHLGKITANGDGFTTIALFILNHYNKPAFAATFDVYYESQQEQKPLLTFYRASISP